MYAKSRVVRASALVREYLGLEPGAKVARVVRLQLCRELPLSLDTLWLPEDLSGPIAHFIWDMGSLYSLLTGFEDLELSRSEEEVTTLRGDRWPSSLDQGRGPGS